MPESEKSTEKTIAEILSVILHRWQQSAIELQAYKRVTESDSQLQETVKKTLETPRFLEQMNLTETLRLRVLHAVEGENQPEFSEALAELGAQLGATPVFPADDIRP